MRGEEELRSWVERELGAPLARFERVGPGASRVTWRCDTAADSSAILRCDSSDGPLSGTELDLAREAEVYRALRGTPVRIPRLIAELGRGEALLVERVPGSEQVAALDPDARAKIALDFMCALAELHRVEARELRLEGFARPAGAQDAARLELALWRRIHDARTGRDDPILDFALEWLEVNAPDSGAQSSLCHGDAGAGNFLFAGGRVTALLDWEFAHLGDPLDDLAWVAIRAQLARGFGDLGECFACWSSETGLAVERERVEYFRALVLLRMAIACRVALARTGGPRGEPTMDTSIYELLLPYLRELLPEALSRAGAERPPHRPSEPSPLVAALGGLSTLP